jgi:predicted acyl esterase
MPNQIRDISTTETGDFPYILEKNVSIPLKSSGDGSGLVRANVYRPKDSGEKPVPVLVTYGPYGKDIYYGE